MAEAIVSLVRERLGELLIQEADFLHGVEEQVRQLQTELMLLQRFLEDIDRRQDKDEGVLFWISEIREAAYYAEDVIETFALKIASRRRRRIQSTFKRYACIINEAAEIHQVRFEIEAIKNKIFNLRTSFPSHGITFKSEAEASSSAHGRSQQQWRQSYSHLVQEYTVGVYKDVNVLVSQLMNEENRCAVVSICGMGGLGKTTLAKKVYQHSEISRFFYGFAWAYVSQQCKPRDVFEVILFQLTSPSKEQREQVQGLRDEALAKKLYKVQQEKKCLVVLDDIWTTEAWDSLRPAFPLRKGSSKILLTTRVEAVASYIDVPSSFLHKLRCLNGDESWELLKKAAFKEKEESGFRISNGMEQLGRKMLKWCGNLPLAIVVLGGILEAKHTLNEWKMVHDNISSYLHGKEAHEHYISEVSTVLLLSYHTLPYQLKLCFLHLGHFPEDYDIPIKKLIRIWVAEGIVSQMECEAKRKRTMEDLAESYLSELQDRCMVQVGVKGSSGKVMTCRLHDLMRDLILFIGKEENFLKLIQVGNEPNDFVSSRVAISNSSYPIHRLAIHLNNETYENFYGKHHPNLWSLFFFSPSHYGTRISQKTISRVSDCILLKVLDLESCYIAGKLTRAIGNLMHLRYLSLNCSLITNIPSSIGNLRHLQTLILQTHRSVEIRVPNVIWKMERLRHLYLPTYIKKSSGKLQLGSLSDLKTLQGFDTRSCEVKELIKFVNLEILRITDLGSFEELEEILISPRVTLDHLCSLKINMRINSYVKKTSLQRLLSSCQYLHTLTLRGQIEKLPECRQFPPNLTKLTLWGSELEEDPMETLEKLPNLSILRLHWKAFSGKVMVCSLQCFPQLKSLALFNLPNLEEWQISIEAMPNLCELVIDRCWKLKMVPDGLRFITTLRELQIVNMPKAFTNRLRVSNERGGGGEDLDKVYHVPSIIFKTVND
ncbi:hypothetical protein L1049_014541 [Liquidambar formosana]|uniref:Disease resistance protein At1g50180 n=1 Tax=Liquidambar formosana TaxID=63359 RepID=A0AAP0S2X5_LIQFO